MRPRNTTLSHTDTVSATRTAIERSPWQSPLPYLFVGLAAMLGLISLALLILACSYRKVSSDRNLNNNGEDDERRRELEKPESGGAEAVKAGLEEKIVVIMAGDVKPTFLATPMSMKLKAAATTSDRNEKDYEKEMRDEDDEKAENWKKDYMTDHHVQASTATAAFFCDSE